MIEAIRRISRTSVVRHRLEEQRNAVAYRVVDDDSPRAHHHQEGEILTLGQKVLESHIFTNVMALIIITNGVIIGLETDYKEFKYWSFVEAVFLVIFLWELIFKMWVEGWSFWHPDQEDFLWNLFDLVVVTLACLDFISSVCGFGKASGGFATIFRMARLMRVLRIIRLLKVLKPLFLLAVGLVEACKAVIWVTLLMGTVLYVFSIVLVKTMGQVPQTDPHYEFLSYHFRSIPACMITLFVLMSSPNLPMYQDEEGLLEARPLFCFFLIMFICFGSFGMIAMLTGVINESMFENNEMRKHEKKQEHEKMRMTLGSSAADLYETLPLDDRGCARVEDLKNISEAAAELLDQSGITIAHGDITRFLELMDDSESGYIDLVEFVHAIEKIAEGVSPLAIIEVQHHTALCNQKVTKQLEQMQAIEVAIEKQMDKTEEEVGRIVKDLDSEQHQQREKLIAQIEAQMVSLTKEVHRMLQLMTDEQDAHRGQLIEKMESQMLHMSKEVDRIFNIVTGARPSPPVSADGGSARSDGGSARRAADEGVNRILRDMTDGQNKQRENLEEKLGAQMVHITKEVDRMLQVMTAAQSDHRSHLVEKIESHMLRSSAQSDQILRIVTGGESRVPRSPSAAQGMGEPTRDVQILSEMMQRSDSRTSDSSQLLSEMMQQRSDSRGSNDSAAVAKQVSRQTERVASSVQSIIERKFADLERQRALKESSDKCVQLAMSSQLQDISATLYKLLHEGGLLQPQFQYYNQFNRQEHAMESLRSDLAVLMSEFKNSFLQLVQAQGVVKEDMELLTSKVCTLEREADTLQTQVMGSVAELGGEIISSLTDLLSNSMIKLK